MRCKDIELLIIDSSEQQLSAQERRALEQHTSHCADCRKFREDYEKIHLSLRKLTFPSLPEEVERETRDTCLTELRLRQESSATSGFKTRIPAIPPLVWAALLVLIVLTVIILIPAVTELILEQTLNFQNTAVLTLILQNTVMLIIAPLIFRKFRSQKKSRLL